MWDSLTVARCLKFCSQPSENVYLSVAFILSYRLSFCNYHRPNYVAIIIGTIMGFPADHIAVNQSLSTLSSCTNLGSFNVCFLKSFLPLPLHAVNNCNWSFFYVINN